MIYQVKYKSSTINYVVVDRKKSVLSIKHKMNIKWEKVKEILVLMDLIKK